VVYTRVLTLAQLETAVLPWLAVYNVIYVSAARHRDRVRKDHGARKLSESEGRVLKLVSGFMMLGFGLLLLLAPQCSQPAGIDPRAGGGGSRGARAARFRQPQAA